MPTNTVVILMQQVATLKADVDWIKKGIYLCIGSSASAFVAVLCEIAVKFLVK